MPDDEQRAALWGYPLPGESRWPASAAVAMAIVMFLILPDKLVAGPRLALPVLETALLVPLMIANPSKLSHESRDMRYLSIALIALINLANIASLALLVHYLLAGGKADGRQLIEAGIGVWATLVIVFALWYWELDRGGPQARCRRDHGPPDFLFPQMENPAVAKGEWAPRFVDYFYVSLTNATAFSPTDTMPLTGRAKLVMAAQSVASLTTIALVGARAVNILT